VRLLPSRPRQVPVVDADRPLRVAFLDHCAQLSGGELALSRLLPSLPVDAHVVLAEEGPLVQLLELLEIETTVLPMRPRSRALPRDRVVPGRAAIRAAADTAEYVWQLRGWLRARDFDVVHTNSLKAAVYGGLAGRLAGIPVVWHVRDRIADDYLPSPAVRLVRFLSGVLPSAIIANSKATMSTLPRRRSRLSLMRVLSDAASEVDDQPEAERLHVLHNAAVFSRSDLPTVHERDEVVVGIVGRLAPWKGQDVFLRAFAEAFPDTGHAVLVGSAMFGEEAYERSLHELVATLGIAGRVHFTGFRDDVSAVLQELDIFVHASVIPEPFGQVIIEAMAAGLPVIAAGAGGPLEIITSEVDGLFHEPGDAHDLATVMRRVAADPALRRRLGEAARASVSRFRPEKVASGLMMIYYDALTH
jgi:glycosyltransferase involved in cell wall biosynthesis